MFSLHDQTIFCNFLLDQGPFCGATDCPYFDLVWPSPSVSKPGWFSRLHAYLLVHSELKALADLGGHARHAPPPKGPNSFVLTYKIFET